MFECCIRDGEPGNAGFLTSVGTSLLIPPVRDLRATVLIQQNIVRLDLAVDETMDMGIA